MNVGNKFTNTDGVEAWKNTKVRGILTEENLNSVNNVMNDYIRELYIQISDCPALIYLENALPEDVKIEISAGKVFEGLDWHYPLVILRNDVRLEGLVNFDEDDELLIEGLEFTKDQVKSFRQDLRSFTNFLNSGYFGPFSENAKILIGKRVTSINLGVKDLNGKYSKEFVDTFLIDLKEKLIKL